MTEDPEQRRARVARQLDQIVLAIVFTALGLTAYVVIVGGIVCVTDNGYPFASYVEDLRQMSHWVLAAAVVVAAKLLAPLIRIERRRDDRGDRGA